MHGKRDGRSVANGASRLLFRPCGKNSKSAFSMYSRVIHGRLKISGWWSFLLFILWYIRWVSRETECSNAETDSSSHFRRR